MILWRYPFNSPQKYNKISILPKIKSKKMVSKYAKAIAASYKICNFCFKICKNCRFLAFFCGEMNFLFIFAKSIPMTKTRSDQLRQLLSKIIISITI